MKPLLDSLTSEPHIWNPDASWYDTVDRIGPAGNKLTIDVEIGADWDGTPKPEILYYARVANNTDIGEGLMIKADSWIILDSDERNDFRYAPECVDWIEGCEEADEHEKDSESYFSSTR